MYNKSFLTVFLIAIFSVGSFAQSGKLKRAKRYYDNLNYIDAIETYNQVLEKSDNAEAKIYLADSYRKINDTENAEYWYGQVVRLPEAESIHKLYYGQMLQRNNKCDLAKEWYEQYVEAVPDDLRGQYLVKACDYEEELRTKSADLYEIKHLEINSNLDDFSPALFKDKLIIASERDKGSAVKRRHSWTGNPFLELYTIELKESGESEKCNYQFGRPEKFSKDINTKFHEAAVSLNQGQNEIFFTRNNFLDGKLGKSDDGIVKLKVYSASIAEDGELSNETSLPFNSDEYSVAHPALSPDSEKLYFASDMPGGFGGMDLYVSEKENGRWGPPMNLGPVINTEGHEIFPYFGPNDRLYFSSDGHIGLGGLDIYYVIKKEEEEWTEPENLGYPINTTKDDFGVIFNELGTCGFFSSDRDGGAGRDDIYSFVKNATPVEIYVFDEITEEPIEGATVINDCKDLVLTTDKNGKAFLEMKMNTCCNFTASKEIYNDGKKEGCTKEITLGETVRIEIPLQKSYEFDVEGIIFDQLTGLPLSGAVVTLENKSDEEVEPLVVATDSSGRYTFELDYGNCYTVKAAKDGYFAQSEGVCTEGISEDSVFQVNINLMPLTVGENQRFTQDPETGLWIDKDTGEPADGTYNGITYTDGEITEVGDDVFVQSPTNGNGYTDDYDPDLDGNGIIDENEQALLDSRGGANGNSDGILAYLLHIYYDFDQSYLRDEAAPELEKLLRLLENNRDFVVEIGAHTDSRGSNRYNRRLSQRRSEAVVRWLVEKGISRDRLVPKGYGETINVNQCANNIPCSEQEHQFNRRTEFKVLGCEGCKDNPVEISKPNTSTEVDPCHGCPF